MGVQAAWTQCLGTPFNYLHIQPAEVALGIAPCKVTAMQTKGAARALEGSDRGWWRMRTLSYATPAMIGFHAGQRARFSAASVYSL